MNEQLTKQLCEKYPVLFSKSRGFDVFECDDGWYNLLDEVCKKIVDLIPVQDQDGIFEQIKEKFGGLRIYVKGLPQNSYDVVYKIINEAEKKSLGICEICGEVGQLCSRRGWLKTVCDKHRLEEGFVVADFKPVMINI